MTVGGVLPVIAVGALAILLAAAVVLARRRAGRAALACAEASVRPVLFRAIDAGGMDDETFGALSPVEQRSLEAQARSLLPKLRGQDRETLGHLLDRLGAVDTARRQARSGRPGARARAGAFLGESGSPEAVRDLVRLLHDADPQVRWTAARALGRLGHTSALSPLFSALEGPRPLPVDVVADAVFQIRDCPISLLRQGLKSQAAPTRAVAVELLGRFQALIAADEVMTLLHRDPSVEVRARAARSLGRMGSPVSVESLVSCLDGGPAAMRAQAIWALGEIGDARALPVLRAVLTGTAHHMSELAADALSVMGLSATAVLEEVAATGDGRAAEAASRALATRKELQPARS